MFKNSFMKKIKERLEKVLWNEGDYDLTQRYYELKYPHLKKQKLGEKRDVYCDGSVEDNRFSTNIYPFIGESNEQNWGYSGSGPLELSINTLFTFTDGDRQFARKNYQQFCQDFLKSKKQSETLKINAKDILRWIENKEYNEAAIRRQGAKKNV